MDLDPKHCKTILFFLHVCARLGHPGDREQSDERRGERSEPVPGPNSKSTFILSKASVK